MMKNKDSVNQLAEKESEKRPYSRPAIIYSTEITTRAGSPLALDGSADSSSVDPMDLFGD